MTGVLPHSHVVTYHHLVIGVGHIQINGSHCGPIFLKPVYRVKNCCIAGVGRDARTANVSRRTLNIPFSVHARPNVQMGNSQMYC